MYSMTLYFKVQSEKGKIIKIEKNIMQPIYERNV